MRILVLSDTHIPKTASDMPKELYDAINTVDMVFHAGDFCERDFFERLKGLKELKAVCGNMDAMSIRNILNNKELIKIGKLKIGLIHGYGAPADIIDTVKKEFPKVDAIVFGHSHSATNIVKDGTLFFNPGSPTDKVFAAYNSYGILKIDGNTIKGEIIKI